MAEDIQYDADSLSHFFRAMYDIPNNVAVFDKAMLCPKKLQYPDLGTTYWVHVTNMAREWEHDIIDDLWSEDVVPREYNNIVDVMSPSPNDGKVKIFMHYKTCAPGLPQDL